MALVADITETTPVSLCWLFDLIYYILYAFAMVVIEFNSI